MDDKRISIVDTALHGQAPVNILIVDDEPKNLTVLEAILDDPGYRLVRAESAEQALIALLADEFALLILDIRMPGVTGFELAQMIRERKKTASVPIIFLTAYYHEDQHIIEGYDAGAVDYLLKPLNPAILRSKVAIFAELYRKQRNLEDVNRALLAEVSSRRRAEEQLRELNDTLERRVAERTASLHSSTERLRAIYDGTFEYMWLLAPDGSVLEANRSALEFAGCDLANVAGKPFWETPWFRSPPDAGKVIRQATARAAAGAPQRFEVSIHTPAGEERAVDISFRPVRDDNGRVILIVPAGLDITARMRAERVVRDRERYLREIIDELPAAVFTVDAKGRLAHYNRACIELAGHVPDLETDQWCIGHQLYHADGTAMRRDECPMAVAMRNDKSLQNAEMIVQRPDGTSTLVASYPTVIHDEQGRIVGGINILIDITERKRNEEHIRLLLKEVDHRSKNILSVVQAIARQTVVASPKEFMARFSERIQTLAASHDLLVKSRWQGIEISDLIRVQLGHFNDLLDRRIKLDGPSLRLSVAAAQTFGMIVHELATNAAKYGALSNDQGSIDIRWCANDQFTIGWTERGGPRVAAPSRRGFGSTVVKTMAESSLDGDVNLDFPPTGLHWRLVCPSSKILEKAAHRVHESRSREKVAQAKS